MDPLSCRSSHVLGDRFVATETAPELVVLAPESGDLLLQTHDLRLLSHIAWFRIHRFRYVDSEFGDCTI
jgi:hypothetical protein